MRRYTTYMWQKMVVRRGGAIMAMLIGLVTVRVTAGQYIIIPWKGLQDFLTLSFSVLIEALPFVILGAVVAVTIRLWLPADALLRWLPKRPLLRRVSLSLCGAFLPVCECGNVPVARGLLARGLTPAEALTFLLAVPILNPVTIITTQQAFADDSVILWSRVIGGFLIANIIGWVYAKAPREQCVQASFLLACQHEAPHSDKGRLAASMALFRREVTALLPALAIGAMIAAAIQVAVPREVLLSVGVHPVWSVLAMTVLAFVVSICSSVDAFFALAFRHAFTPGSLASFLIFGPLVDIKMLSLLRTTFRGRLLIEVSVMVAAAAIVGGLVVNYAL